MIKQSAYQEWLFTEPFDPVYVRRGDALGWQNIAENFANMLAPSLSNQTWDARWLTILCWCLAASKNVPIDYPLHTRERQRQRYEWLRPLELLWIARTLELKGADNIKGIQLRGIRAVKSWDKSDSNFGMSSDQWKRYRQTGMYGAYRVALRRLPGLTMDEDGWIPGPLGDKLAKLLARKLGANPPEIYHEIKGRSNHDTYWTKTGWKEWYEGSDEWLPISSNDLKPLPDEERELLNKAIFNEDDDTGGKSRLAVARAIGKTKTDDHSRLCAAVVEELKKNYENPELELLVPFSQFADSALDVINSVWEEMGKTQSSEKFPIKELIKNEEIRDNLAVLKEFADRWKENKGNFYSVGNLARDVVSKKENNPEILKSLIKHHTINGGGRKWLKLNDNDVESSMSTRTQGASYYRFRLWQLGRLAIQCGIIKNLPKALKHEEIEEDYEE